MSFNFTEISLFLFMSLSTSAYTKRYNITGLNTLFQSNEVKFAQPSFSIHQIENDLYIVCRGSQDDADFLTYSSLNEINTPYGVFHSGYYQAAMYVFSRSMYYISNCKGKVYFTGHSYICPFPRLFYKICS